MKIKYLFFALLAANSLAYGDVYKSVDENGNVTYSNSPSKGAKKVDLPPISIVPASPVPPQETAKPEAPSAKADKRKMLEDQLAQEEAALEKAKQALKLAEDTPHVFVKPGGGIGRNVVAYEESVRKAKEEVALHEKNIEQIKAELAKLQ